MCFRNVNITVSLQNGEIHKSFYTDNVIEDEEKVNEKIALSNGFKKIEKIWLTKKITPILFSKKYFNDENLTEYKYHNEKYKDDYIRKIIPYSEKFQLYIVRSINNTPDNNPSFDFFDNTCWVTMVVNDVDFNILQEMIYKGGISVTFGFESTQKNDRGFSESIEYEYRDMVVDGVNKKILIMDADASKIELSRIDISSILKEVEENNSEKILSNIQPILLDQISELKNINNQLTNNMIKYESFKKTVIWFLSLILLMIFFTAIR